MIGHSEDSSQDACLSHGDYCHKDHVEERFYVFFGLVNCFFCFIVFLPGPAQYISYFMARYCAEGAVKPVMWSETVGLRTRPDRPKKIGLGLGLASLVLR